MTPEERKLVTELFDRLATLEDAERDAEAERLIDDGLRQAPNAPYALVQTVLVQDEALKRANARIRDLEDGGEPPRRDTSFLGGMRDSLLGKPAGRSSVPSVRPGGPSPEDGSGMSPAWRTATQPGASGAMPAPGPTSGPMGMGGSFLGTAASAAAGVIGGSLLLDGIRSMMGHHPGAHAALGQSAGAASPWSADTAGGGLSRQAGLDDIGRSPDSNPAGDSRHGLLDDRSNDEPAVEGADAAAGDIDDGDIDDGDIDEGDLDLGDGDPADQ
jgi:hypothetical protein